MNRRTLVALSACAVAAAAAVLPSVAAASTTSPHYYLALGDSLSQGMQPNAQGVTVNTKQGYANDLLKIERSKIDNLKLVQLGCGGETSGSMLTGHGNDANARLLHCDRVGGSQLTAAERFLRAHHAKGEVPLVTVDIGANDVDGCTTAANVVGCVTQGLHAISQNLPKIFAGLRKAAPAGTTFVAMNLYDPILGGYVAPAGTTSNALAMPSLVLDKDLNSTLAKADKAAGFLTADVADAFDTYDSATNVVWQGQQTPLDVARVCSWTWMCHAAPQGPNIHANETGYHVIADAFAKTIGNRLSDSH